MTQHIFVNKENRDDFLVIKTDPEHSPSLLEKYEKIAISKYEVLGDGPSVVNYTKEEVLERINRSKKEMEKIEQELKKLPGKP